jgi:hypothetical protein
VSRQLVMYAIYRHPADYPGEFIMRRWAGLTCTPIDQGAPFARGRTLEEVQQALPPGLYNMGRQALDDPVVVEVWM